MGIQHRPGPQGQFIFRDQSHGKDQGITGDFFFRPGNGPQMFIHLSHHYAFQPVPATDIRYCMAQIEGNIIIMEALFDVPGQTAGNGIDFIDTLHMSPSRVSRRAMIRPISPDPRITTSCRASGSGD